MLHIIEVYTEWSNTKIEFHVCIIYFMYVFHVSFKYYLFVKEIFNFFFTLYDIKESISKIHVKRIPETRRVC